MNRTLPLLLFFLILISITRTYAQDMIYMKSGQEIMGWVSEKSDRLVKYRLFNADDSPVIVLKSSKINKITFRNGQEEYFQPEGVRMNMRAGINGGLMLGIGEETAFYKTQIDYFLTPEWNILANWLVDVEGDGMGISAGGCYYFNPYKITKIKVYAGLTAGFTDDLFFQTPVGLSFTSNRGFDAKLGLNGIFSPAWGGGGITAELLIGLRF